MGVAMVVAAQGEGLVHPVVVVGREVGQEVLPQGERHQVVVVGQEVGQKVPPPEQGPTHRAAVVVACLGGL